MRVFATVWAALAALSTLWALATPISASPDEPAHLVKAAAVVRGQWMGPASEDGNVVTVPLYIAWTHALTCFANNDEVTAACQAASPLPGDPAEPTRSATTAGTYNPLYYLLVGWPSLIAQDTWGIYTMRIVSGVVTSLFVAMAASLVSFWRRRVLGYVALVGVATPMLLFLAGSVNPNGLETTTTLATVVAMLSIVRERERVPPGLAYSVLIAAAAIGANTRALAPLWIVVALLVPLILLDRSELVPLLRARATIVAIVTIGIAGLLAGAWTIAAAPLTADPNADILYPGTGQAPLVGFLYVLERTVPFTAHMIGLFGWMDTPAPTTVLFVWTILIGGLIVAAVAAARRRALVAVWTSLAALVLLPALAQAVWITSGGFIWQGRYAFALLCVALMVAAVALAERVRSAGRATRRLVVLGAIAVAAMQLYAFAFVLKRYTNGSTDTWLGLLKDAMWQAPGGNLVLVGAVAVVAATSAVLVARGMLRAARDEAYHVHDGPEGRADAERHGNAQQQVSR